MDAKSENFSVRLPTDIRQRVDELARATRRSRSFIINEAVATYLRHQEEFFAEIDAAVASAERGTGHSKEQVFDWMDAWANGNKKPLPKPDIRRKK